MTPKTDAATAIFQSVAGSRCPSANLTVYRTYDTTPAVGRKKLFPVRITLPLSAEMATRVDIVLAEKEDRVAMIRHAIEREIKRRERAKR